MLSTAIIIFRETLEIAMILGIVLAATRGLPGRLKWIGGGFVAGALGAGLVALFAETISNSASGMGQEFFNAMILFAAAIVIGWTALWVRGHAHMMAMQFRKLGHEVVRGSVPRYTLSVIIGLAILREGSEIVLFIYGMFLSGQSVPSIAMGSVIGVVMGVAAGILLYCGLLKIPTKHALNVTSWLLVLLVAGLASQGINYMSTAGYFNGLSQQVWDTSWLLSEDSIVGKSLHSLIGYSARPTVIQLIVYFGTLGGLLAMIRVIDKKKIHKKAATVAALVLLAASVKTAPAYALDEIYSPNAEQGETSLEYNGSRTFDNHTAKNNDQEHEIALEHGFNSWFTGEVSGGFAKEPDNALKLEHVEVEGRAQFTQPGEYWVDSGMLAAYDFSTISREPNSTEIKLLLQKDIGRITSTANVGFEQDVGKNSDKTGGPDWALLWNTRYRYSEYFEPGVEFQGDLGQRRIVGQFNRQEDYLGPAVYGHLFGNLKYQVAYLAGVSDAAAEGAGRVLLEYEMHF